MAELSTQDPTGTRGQGVRLTTTVYELENAIGPFNAFTHETGNDWVCETADGDVFTIYAWNVIGGIGKYELIEWRIGAHTKYVSLTAKEELISLIN